MAQADDPLSGKAEWFDRHYATGRGRVRLELVLERLLEALPPAPATVLDAGGGTGAFAIPLAQRGYDVTILDRSREWLAVAADRSAEAEVELRLTEGTAEDAARLVPGPFDVVLCHTVLIYADQPAAVLATLRAVAGDGAVLSVLEKNRLGLPLRPAREGDYAEARRVLDDPVAAGRLGVPNRAFAPGELRALLLRTGWRPLGPWAGIRVFSDGAPEDLDDQAVGRLVALDREAAGREPYRRIARLIHQMARAVPAIAPSLGEIQARSHRMASLATGDSWPVDRALGADELDAFLGRKRYGVLATARKDGRPHAAMIAFSVRDGRIWLPAMTGAARVRNVIVEPSATLVVSEGEAAEHVAVMIEGEAIVHTDPGPILDAWLRDAWRDRFGSRLEDWVDAIIELIPTKVLSHRAG